MSINAVWSVKNAYVGSGKHALGSFPDRPTATFARLKTYCTDLATTADSILVVSGTGAKKQLDAVEVTFPTVLDVCMLTTRGSRVQSEKNAQRYMEAS